MSGIAATTGLISGLNTGAIIDSLIAVEAEPENIIKQHVTQLQTQEAAYLSINSVLQGLLSAAQNLRLNSLFDSATVQSSNSAVLTGTAAAGATPGDYSFLVDRTVTTDQALSQGFVDRSTSGIGLTSLTFESTQARLDNDTELNSLNGGAGVSRGQIIVTNRAGASTTVDLSRVANVSEVLGAINSSSAGVTASVSGGKLVLTDNSGGTGALSVHDASGYTTAESLGLTGTASGNTLTGSTISYLGDNTTIQSLNDGNGIRIGTVVQGNDFTITDQAGTSYSVDIGSVYNNSGGTLTTTAAPVTTVAQLKQRISDATHGNVTLQASADGSGLVLVDHSTQTGTNQLTVTDISGAATDLGFTTGTGAAGTGSFGSGTANSKQLLAALQSRLASNLNGSQGLTANDLSVTTHDGNQFDLALDTTGSVTDLFQSISDQTNGLVTASLDSNGTSVILTDHTSGSSNLIISGGAAGELGLQTPTGGVAGGTFTGSEVNREYVALSTPLASLNDGRGVGTGSFQIVGPSGASATINVDSTVHTVGDLVNKINGNSLGVVAKINDAGNGIIVEKDPGFTGADQKITISDASGGVAEALNLAGTASGTGTSNFIDGSYRVSVGVGATDTLDQIISKINSSNAGVTASVVTDGSSGAPYRLKLTSNNAGEDGRFLTTSAGTNLGLTTVSQGQDARIFYGSDDPATAILIKRDTNSIDGVVDGLSANILTASTTPVTLTVSRDTPTTVSAIQQFVTAFNTVVSKISDLTQYDSTTDTSGTLLGDSTTLSLQSELYSTLQSSALGVGGQYTRLSQVGLSVNQDGTIAIDSTQLTSALQTNPSAVKDLFSGFTQNPIPPTVAIPGVTGATVANTSTTNTYSKLGVLELIGQLANKYIDPTSGILIATNKNLDSEIADDNARIADYDARLADKRTQLQTQFANLETTLATLQSQQSSISNIQNIS